MFFMKWGQMMTTDLNERLDLFFKIIDTDGNGMLDYDEIMEIVQISLTAAMPYKNEEFILFVSEYFTDVIF